MTVLASRPCPLCRGSAGYHVADCPRHDPRTCLLCGKIALQHVDVERKPA